MRHRSLATIGIYCGMCAAVSSAQHNEPQTEATRLSGVAAAARRAVVPGYDDYTAWADWARLHVGTRAGLASSYDRSGGNADYSQYEWPEGLIHGETLATVKTIDGPGVIYRFWMPHLTSNRDFVVRMYFDGEQRPRIDTMSSVLFRGEFSYFDPPLVNTFAGGQVCYEPIPFARSLRIETVNHEPPSHRHYYQYSYMTFPRETEIDSYTGVLPPERRAARDQMVRLFAEAGQHPGGDSPSAIEVTTPATAIPAGQCLTMAKLAGPGLIRRLSLRMDGATDVELSGLRLAVTYDQQDAPAIDVPVAEFFGTGKLRAQYKSMPIGTNSPDGFYCFWPMPFRYSVSVELCNTTDATISIDAGEVEYERGPLSTDMCYLHARSHTSERAPEQVYHQMLAATGRGHYVGNLLFVEQDNWSFAMLEGDEVIAVDGQYALNGTGLEDAYNGGYYYNWVAAQPGEPEGPRPRSAIRPLNGILYVHREDGIDYARADQYRWYIADRIPFSTSIDVKIENRYAAQGATWTSVAFWYQQPPIPGDWDSDGDLDLVDFSGFQGCFGSKRPPCLDVYDVDSNGAVDLVDYAVIADMFTGPW